MAFVYMHGLSSSWDAQTVALLLNKRQSSTTQVEADDEVHVRILSNSATDDQGNAVASVMFSSEIEMNQTVKSYQGLPIPMTHGYHFYCFSSVWPLGTSSEETTKDSQQSQEETQSVSVPSPPLHSQLMALPTHTLERRLRHQNHQHNDMEHENVLCGGKKSGRVQHHARLAHELSITFGENSRPCKEIDGVPLSAVLTEPILLYLRTCSLWPPRSKQRRGVQSGHYLTLRKSHPADHDILWDLCRALIHSVVPDARYTALAITESFVGSPHVDAHDTTFQHVVALGNFCGGRLCADGNDEQGVVTKINVRNRLGRLDGRHVHWVEGWSGERFSVVYYSTAREDFTEPQSQSTYNEWMASISIAQSSRWGV